MTEQDKSKNRSELMPTGALILAAGFSRRFGGIKLHAELGNGLTVFHQTLSNISAATENILVVTRPELVETISSISQQFFPTTQITVCADSDKGMGHTLAHGIQQIRDWEACLVCLGDMPFVKPQTYRQLLERSKSSAIIVPRVQGEIGNPVSFGRDFFAQIATIEGDTGARRLLNTFPEAVQYVEVEDKAILQDIDTPEDISRWDT